MTRKACYGGKKKHEDKPLMLSNNVYFQIIESVFHQCVWSHHFLCFYGVELSHSLLTRTRIFSRFGT